MAEDTRNPVLDWSDEHVRYPNHYAWFVLASSLDILMTMIVLELGGREANPLAERVITAFGMHGVLVFKFAMMGLVILLCEIIGRQRDLWGRRIASFAIIVPAFGALMGYTLITRAMGL